MYSIFSISPPQSDPSSPHNPTPTHFVSTLAGLLTENGNSSLRLVKSNKHALGLVQSNHENFNTSSVGLNTEHLISGLHNLNASATAPLPKNPPAYISNSPSFTFLNID